MKTKLSNLSGRGFTLIEVVVAMAISSFGLLGLAKMQALAISSTQNSGGRALIALQVSSLASAMHANRAFWASGVAPASFSASGTTVTDNSSVLNANITGNCIATACTPAQMAAADVQSWVADMNNQFPSYNAEVNCSTDVTQAINCAIYVNWSEKQIAINRSTATGSTNQVATQRFSIYVKP